MKKIFSTVCVFLLLCSSSWALSEGTFQIIIKKQEEKMNNRWSLSDYLHTKKQMALMDQWLAFHSSPPSPEFSIWGARNDVTAAALAETNLGNEVGASLYYRIFGIEGKLEEVSPIIRDKNLFFGLRIFGRADQGSHLKLLYGVEQTYDYQLKEQASNQIAAGAATFYLLPFLGIDGLYKKFQAASFKASSTELTGESIEFGAFLEIYFLRFFIKEQNKKLYYKDSTSQSKKTFKTKSLGVRIYF